MSLILPYIFTGGTSAKAQEVNANFQQVKRFVDKLEEQQSNYSELIADLQNNKAELNGSSSNVFNVASPTGDNNAVNKAYLDQQMSIFKPVIIGLKVTKIGNQSFTIGIGSCFDSNYLHPIINRVVYSSYSYPFDASTTYNIYVTARVSDSMDFNCVFTTGANTPTLIYEDTIYRKIGTLTTDASAYIDTITQETL